jgi:hypothetical protein
MVQAGLLTAEVGRTLTRRMMGVAMDHRRSHGSIAHMKVETTDHPVVSAAAQPVVVDRNFATSL